MNFTNKHTTAVSVFTLMTCVSVSCVSSPVFAAGFDDNLKTGFQKSQATGKIIRKKANQPVKRKGFFQQFTEGFQAARNKRAKAVNKVKRADKKPAKMMAPVKKPAQPKMAKKMMPAPKKDVLLMNHLKGVVIVGHPNEIKKGGVNVTGIKVPNKKNVAVPGEVWNTVKARLGKPLTLNGLNQMTRSMVKMYRQGGYQTVSIVTPPQDVTNGVVQVLVVIGRMGNLTVEGNKYYGKNYYQRNFTTRPGEALTSAKVVEDLRWINRSAFRKVDLVYKPGPGFGQTDVVLRAHEARPQTIFAGMDNTGNGAFGNERAYVGFQLGNLWKRDHQLMYRITSNIESSKLLSHYAEYRAPMVGRQELRFTGSFSEYDGDVNNLNQTGDNASYAVNYIKQSKRIGKYAGDFIAGVQHRRVNGDLIFDNQNVRDEKSEYTQGSIGWAGEKITLHGTTRVDASIVGALDGDFQVDNVKRDADHVYFKVGYHDRKDFNNDTRLFTSIKGQYSKDNLPSAESFYLGGRGSVRGWKQNEERVDGGLTANVTYFGPNMVRRKQGHALRGYAFLDGGWGKVNSVAAGEDDTRTLVGTGFGVNYQMGRHASIDLSYGRQLHEDGFNDANSDEIYGTIQFRY